MGTAIEYADEVWEPVSGCTPVSAGCRLCWARKLAETRLQRFYPDGFSRVRVHPERLGQPLHWRKPRRVFVCSRADLFHEDVPRDFIDRVFDVMALARSHTYLLLTKRPERMVAYLKDLSISVATWPLPVDERAYRVALATFIRSVSHWPLPNVWLGVSVEEQGRADERIPVLVETPAAVRWVSLEPLLGPVNLEGMLGRWDGGSLQVWRRQIDWVVVGCESGPGARPMDEDWVRAIRDQCVEAFVAFYYKQRMEGGRKVSLPYLDGRQWAEMPRARR